MINICDAFFTQKDSDENANGYCAANNIIEAPAAPIIADIHNSFLKNDGDSDTNLRHIFLSVKLSFI